MTEDTQVTLRELQNLDGEIDEVQAKVAAFDPLLAEVEEPALVLEEEAKTIRDRLKQMKVDERRLEGTSDEKRERLKKMQERLDAVQNVREEAAVRAETDMLRRALETDEQEALALLDQIRRSEDMLEELEGKVKAAREEVEPRRDELLKERSEFSGQLETLQSRREDFIGRIAEPERRVYDSFRAGGRKVVVATLTEDGACGHCYGIVPLQKQNEVRQDRGMIRCESCGVILSPPEAGE
ncbi:MAG: hypothetical protein WDZ89_02005 [Gemmatimonadota bacterium]